MSIIRFLMRKVINIFCIIQNDFAVQSQLTKKTADGQISSICFLFLSDILSADTLTLINVSLTDYLHNMTGVNMVVDIGNGTANILQVNNKRVIEDKSVYDCCAESGHGRLRQKD